MIKIFLKIFLLIFLLTEMVYAEPLLSGDGDKKETQLIKQPIKFNRISLPIYEAGQIGNRTTNLSRNAGRVDTLGFLYSSGFLLSGYDENNNLWANGVEQTRRILDYVEGTVTNPNDPFGVYTNSINSIPFGEEWQNWKYAVTLGAEFYDGDNDGLYSPIDKNQNGKWDEDEDRPALYGDVMVWSAFNDGTPASGRKIADTKPLGINIRQTVWGYSNNPNLDKVVFIKYSIENTGTVSQTLYDVNFSIATDPDLGYYRDDRLATDIQNNTILTYSQFNDYYLNENQIAFATTLIQGPVTEVKYSENAFVLVGEDLDQMQIRGKQNADLIATVDSRDAYFSSQVYQDFGPDIIRKIMLGENNPDPCVGAVNNMDCNDINSKFIYSGDPITRDGWINSRGYDKAFLLTTDYFNLKANEPVEIIFAFILGVAEEPIDAMKEAIKAGREVKYNFFDIPTNFPEVNATTITDNESIDLLWEGLPMQGSQIGSGYDIGFKGYKVYMYNSPSTDETINNQPNKKLLSTYQFPNNININNLLMENGNDYSVSNILSESILYNDRILQHITWDPFNNEPLRKGKPYYFSITPYGVDYSKLVKYGLDDIYLIPSNAMFGYFENIPTIINDNKGNTGIVIGENENDSYFKGVIAEHVEGNSQAQISYSVFEQEKVTDDLYEVSFEKYESEIYSVLMKVENVNKNMPILSKVLSEDYYGNVNDMRDGIIVDVEWVTPGKVQTSFTGDEKWFNEFDNINTGVFYVGDDVKESQKVFPICLYQSRVIKIDDLLNVELRFGDTSKALRYVRTAIRYPWKGKDNPDSGFVSIPVSAYSIDINGNETKLQMAFIENGFPLDSLAMPDGKWNPGSNIAESKEYLVVFNRPFTEDLSKIIEYTGTARRVADIANGYLMYESEVESDSIRAIGRTPWFNAMYVVGLTTPFYQQDFNPTGILKLKPSLVLTEKDKYYFKVKKEKTLDERKEQFDRINVYPNPLFGYNSSSNAFGYENDEPFITFSNLPEEVDIKIYSLSGNLVKSLFKSDLSASLRWDLKNESNMRIASGMYIAIVNVPNIGQKILKFAIVQPQKRVHY